MSEPVHKSVIVPVRNVTSEEGLLRAQPTIKQALGLPSPARCFTAAAHVEFSLPLCDIGQNAFDEDDGAIRVSFKTQSELGEAYLVVEDNGRGMGPPCTGGLGVQLINAFTNQFDRQADQEPVEKGTRTCVKFPLAL